MSSYQLMSVIIPTFNSEKFIRDCLSALIAQKSPISYEIVVVDSGTDNTKNICMEYGVRYFYCKQCNSAGLARNFGIKQARGEIIAFLDVDCIIPENWFQRIIDTFNEHPEIVGILGYYSGGKDLIQKVLNEEFSNKKIIGFHEGFREGNAVFKKRVFDQGCKFGEFKWSEGNVLIRQINELGYETLLDPSFRVTHLSSVTLRKYFAGGKSYVHNSRRYFGNFKRSLVIPLAIIASIVTIIFFFFTGIVFFLSPFIFLNLFFLFHILKQQSTPRKYLLLCAPYLLLTKWIFWSGFLFETLRYFIKGNIA
ncbi:glycosyltransferase family 2 protein [Candidatus Borrarchaeum sp.]|uniref:glycosyltransferase family 2 protein n=1 Tax=Candidatus Borrarchaeum sp. TaxID=2846742 RepID=UPI0025801AA1|nr:glycosyltransferase family 2 protein [Candidatus Borrarchaeum sp.]